MQFFNFFLNSSVLVLVLLMSTKTDGQVRQTIIVDQSGRGSFTTIQNAIDSVPSNNEAWTLIHVKAGIYNEKVTIPRDKPRILLQGESYRSTIVQFGDGGDSIKSSTLSLYADDFVAMDITFKNTYNLEPGKPITWAPAALINADMAAFYRCGFISVQDTLTDSEGRHYFENCYIEGAVDFIWGNGRSIYQGCNLNVTASAQRSGMAAYITAQARDSIVDHSGFVFREGWIFGTGPAYLGRAYKPYARVLFYRTRMSGIIVPQGWSAWNYVGKENSIVYAEVDCRGAGANKSKRVAWEKKLSPKDLSYLLNINTFINNGGWIQRQPKRGS
ncbi:putative pectinesterase 29 [Gossypium australe]|uniref:Pectinesterase n=1 Tax=Gossypium australe TaxID=47621 RepID=A0A5B6WWR5_9ROSI|nr:putative pectinesterase 29 [Gossypium australe]